MPEICVPCSVVTKLLESGQFGIAPANFLACDRNSTSAVTSLHNNNLTYYCDTKFGI